jgi:hypothetical protein
VYREFAVRLGWVGQCRRRYQVQWWDSPLAIEIPCGEPVLQTKFLDHGAFEGLQHTAHTTPGLGSLYTIAGKPSNSWKDLRSEFGSIFSF